MRRPFALLRRRRPADLVLPEETEPGGEPNLDIGIDDETAPTRPPVDTYRGKGRLGRLPQCPSCGRFQLRMERQGSDYHFGCTDCGAAWAWSVRQSWPRTVPRPDLPKPPTQEN